MIGRNARVNHDACTSIIAAPVTVNTAMAATAKRLTLLGLSGVHRP